MSEEKKKWLWQFANLMRAIYKKYPISEEFAKCQSNGDYFDDACNFVGLRHELYELEEYLRKIVRYSEMAEL